VFYDGATLLEPPEFFTDVNTSADWLWNDYEA
jgi:hypothetical protein